MPIRFRPLPVLTLCAIPVFSLLLWLGFWQMDRAEWKTGLIRDFADMSASPAVPLDAYVCTSGSAPNARIFAVAAAGPEARFFGRAANGAAGWRTFAIVKACRENVAVLAETGFQPLPIGPEVGLSPQPEPVALLRFEPWPRTGMFSAANAPERNEWYTFDADALEAFFGGARFDRSRILVAADRPPSFLTQTPPERHIGYAVTWFGMALALVVMYAAFHVRAGRLKVGKGSRPQE